MRARRRFRVWRGDASGGAFQDFEVETDTGMVVLDALLRIQQEQAGDLALRWNCKAGKCGSCSMEIAGRPRLACMLRLDLLASEEAIAVQPLKAFPVIKDLVCDVSWNYRQNLRIRPFEPRPRDADGNHRMYQEEVERVQEFRKCIECFLCQDVCHVLRDHGKHDRFVGPRFMIRLASLDMHPLDGADRIPAVRAELGSGYCNITRCCTEVCPEKIQITDNGIIPLKERVVDRHYDPISRLFRALRGKPAR